MQMHKKTGEMIYSTLRSTATSLSKLHASLANFQYQLKMEKIPSLAKDTRINSLEDLVVKIWNDPTNVEVVEEILKNKNVDILALRKQLKLSKTKDPLTKYIE